MGRPRFCKFGVILCGCVIFMNDLSIVLEDRSSILFVAMTVGWTKQLKSYSLPERVTGRLWSYVLM